MILTPHAIVGAAITNIIPGYPTLGFSLAFISHYILDMIPHIDYEIGGFIDNTSKKVSPIFNNLKSFLHVFKIFIDFVFGLALCILIFVKDEQTFYLTILGVIGGVLPDFLQFIYLKFKHPYTHALQKMHDHFHHPDKMKDRPFRGVVIQVATSVVAVVIYYLFRL
jgi:F0F1-type ATP synthase assembly protein I